MSALSRRRRRDAAPAMAACTSSALMTVFAMLVAPATYAYQNSFFGAQRPFTGQPAGPVREVKLSCLNTVAGPPFNYKMRCPDTAKITEYFDKEGALHRIIHHAPLKGVTSDMARWWFSPALALGAPQVLYNNQFVYWYKLWHPIDHEGLVPLPGVQPDLPVVPAPYVMVSEHYRPGPGDAFQTGYNLTLPSYVSDARFGVQIRLPGGAILASFLNRPWKDSPEGLLFVTELIAGPNVMPGFISRAVNKRLVQPVLNNQLPNLADQVTRHHIEEMGNWEAFLPTIFNKYCNLPCRLALQHPAAKLSGTVG